MAAEVQTQASRSFMTETPLSDPSIKIALKTDSFRTQQKRGRSSRPKRNNTNSDILDSGRPASYASWPDLNKPGALEEEEWTDQGTWRNDDPGFAHRETDTSTNMAAMPWTPRCGCQADGHESAPLNPTFSQELVQDWKPSSVRMLTSTHNKEKATGGDKQKDSGDDKVAMVSSRPQLSQQQIKRGSKVYSSHEAHTTRCQTLGQRTSAHGGQGRGPWSQDPRRYD